ncbi:MAG: hypothetical protein M3P51_12110 [Chloroflexota bacterium]|nr:hypothetical protein [Chloroflexota bacterium]
MTDDGAGLADGPAVGSADAMVGELFAGSGAGDDVTDGVTVGEADALGVVVGRSSSTVGIIVEATEGSGASPYASPAVMGTACAAIGNTPAHSVSRAISSWIRLWRDHRCNELQSIRVAFLPLSSATNRRDGVVRSPDERHTAYIVR